MIFTRGRRRYVDTTGHFCPHAACAYHGRVGWGNSRANGHPNGRHWRQLGCLGCQRHFLETHGTLFHGKQVDPDTLVWAIAALAEGLGLRAVARVFEVDPNTVLGWLVEPADHLEAFSHHFLHDLDVEQVQMDALFALLSAVKDGEATEAEAIKYLSRSPHWVWVAMDPVCKLILAVDVGDRTLAMAQHPVHQVTRVLAPHCAPLFLTDGFREYLTALVTHSGQWIHPERRHAKGPQPTPRGLPLPGLRSAQVGKRYRRWRLVGGTHRVIFGPVATIESSLAKRGWKLNSALVEACIWICVSMWRRSVGGATRCANTKRDCVSSWLCSTPTTILSYPTPACACPCPSWSRSPSQVPSSAGSLGRPRWRRG
jgi:hypothetical protein